MTPREFLENVVEPNFEELRAHYGDPRCGFNAISSVDALAAHLFQWCKIHAPDEVSGLSDDTTYRERLSAQDGDFALVRDVAKAQKHVILTRGNPSVSAADQIMPRSLGWGEARWGEGRWDSPQQVVVKTNNGAFRALEAVVNNSITFLKAEMERLQIP